MGKFQSQFCQTNIHASTTFVCFPPTAILIEEPHASVATPPSIVISEPLISAAPPPLILIEEPHSHVASPPAVGISEPFVSATQSPTLRAIKSHFVATPQPIDDKEMVEAMYDLANLQKLCPLADICTTNKSDKQRMEMENSCCLPCKCDAMCSKMGNCCEKSNSHGYMCHSPYVEDETNIDLGYFMVDTCSVRRR